MSEPIVFLPLSQGKVAVIDFADFEKVGRMKWCAHKERDTFYAWRRSAGKILRLHRELLSAPDGLEVDHKDGDGLNNLRDNLRLSTKGENMGNMKPHRDGSSKFKGVSWKKKDKKWTARIQISGFVIRLGCFIFEEDAARAYDAAAREHFKEFARCNFPSNPQP